MGGLGLVSNVEDALADADRNAWPVGIVVSNYRALFQSPARGRIWHLAQEDHLIVG